MKLHNVPGKTVTRKETKAMTLELSKYPVEISLLFLDKWKILILRD